MSADERKKEPLLAVLAFFNLAVAIRRWRASNNSVQRRFNISKQSVLSLRLSFPYSFQVQYLSAMPNLGAIFKSVIPLLQKQHTKHLIIHPSIYAFMQINS